MKITRERALEMLRGLLDAEEKLDTLNLTRAERREFQKMVEDAFEKPEMISVPTAHGEIRAYVGGDPNYPSIDIRVRPSADSEVEENVAFVESVEGSGIRCAIYGDVDNEEPTHWEYVKGLDKLVDGISEECPER